MRKSALVLVGAALLIGLGAFGLSGSRPASADTTPNSDPAPTVPATTAPPATHLAPPTSASTAPPATSPPTVAHHQATTPNPTQPTAPPATVYQPSYTTYPYTTYPYAYHGTTTSSSTSSTSTTSTTSTTIAGIEGKISNSPQTVPLATKASNGHVSGVFPILAYIGFGLAVLIVLIRLFITRPGGSDRRPIS